MTPVIAGGIVATERELARRAKRRRGRLFGLATMAIAAGVVALLAAISPWVRITVSLTNSLPQRVYLVHVGRLPARGDLVAFRPPPNRFYPDRGGFIKRVRGVAGDEVRWEGRDVFVNGEPLGTAKARSLDGRPLLPSAAGRIPAGRYFVWTPDPDSFDSRYADIGWIDAERVVGVAIPLF